MPSRRPSPTKGGRPWLVTTGIGRAQLPENVRRKLVSAEQAVAGIRAGEQVFVGTACATPRTLVAALEHGSRRRRTSTC